MRILGLRDKNTKELYIGYTGDVGQRLKQHKVIKDIEIVYYEAYLCEKETQIREKKLKMYGSAWRGLKQRLVLTLKYTD